MRKNVIKASRCCCSFTFSSIPSSSNLIVTYYSLLFLCAQQFYASHMYNFYNYLNILIVKKPHLSSIDYDLHCFHRHIWPIRAVHLHKVSQSNIFGLCYVWLSLYKIIMMLKSLFFNSFSTLLNLTDTWIVCMQIILTTFRTGMIFYQMNCDMKIDYLFT